MVPYVLVTSGIKLSMIVNKDYNEISQKRTPTPLWAIFLRRATNSASKFEGTWEPPPVLKLKFKDSTRR